MKEKINLSAFIVPNRTALGLNYGTHNGYVAIPPGHKCYLAQAGYKYPLSKLHVHGGITYAYHYKNATALYLPDTECIAGTDKIPDDWWVLGFDTMHFYDSPDIWNREAVIEETLELKKQLEEM